MYTLLCMLRAGGTQRLPRLIGRSKAKEMIFTGRFVGPEEALDIGMLHVFHATCIIIGRRLGLQHV